MNNIIIINIIRFVILVLIQTLVLNNINFLGYINPYIYILFIILYPIKNNRLLFIFLSFLLGLSVDLFLDSGGIHAASSLVIAYIRPVILKFSLSSVYDHHTLPFSAVDFNKRLTYIVILVVIHHLVLFSLEIFSIQKIILIFKKALFSSIFTVTLSMLLVTLFSKRN